MVDLNDGERPFHDLIVAVAKKTCKTYGWRTTYLRASLVSKNAQPVTDQQMTGWQRTKRVPAWVVDQVEVLDFELAKAAARKNMYWNPTEIEFLIAIYHANAYLTLAGIALHCSDEFGRQISEQAIKGQLDRLRKKGKLDGYSFVDVNNPAQMTLEVAT